MTDSVLYREAGPIGELVLNRPARHNSLVPELLEPLRDQLRALAGAEHLAAVLLRASGPSFSTGADLRRFLEADEAGRLEPYAHELVGLLNECLLAIRALPCPLVCAVQGQVTGGSFGFLLVADVVVMADAASITPWYGVVGFAPDGGWTAILPLLIGPGRAADALLLNRTITAADAFAWGIASRRVPGDMLLDTAWSIARQLDRFRATSLRATRALLDGAFGDLAGRLEAERQAFLAAVVSDEARAGVRAYLAGGHR